MLDLVCKASLNYFAEVLISHGRITLKPKAGIRDRCSEPISEPVDNRLPGSTVYPQSSDPYWALQHGREPVFLSRAA